jgi:hypothetical protein
MELFREVQNFVEDRWSRKEYDTNVFPAIADEALKQFSPAANTSVAEIVQWASTMPLPPQPDLTSNFGQPPLCVAHSSRFQIQVLFWVDGTTSVHQHGFSGAFHVLDGSSIHAQYNFHEQSRVNEFFLMGDVTFKASEILSKGQSRPILPGRNFIHALFHLERPSVTLVIRTHRDVEQGPQYEYFKPGIALDPFFQDPQVLRRCQLLGFMAATNDPGLSAAITQVVRSSRLFDMVQILRYIVDKRLDDAYFEETLALLRLVHGEQGEIVARALENRLRERFIVESRKQVVDADERFLLALLLNLESREAIFRAIRERIGEEPADFVVRCLRNMSQNGEIGPDRKSASDFELGVLKALLLGKDSPRAIASDLQPGFSGADEYEEEIGKLGLVFKHSPVLRPLFG